MSQLKKLQQGEFQIIYPINGKTGLYKKGLEQWVCKQVVPQKKTQKELIDEIDQMKIRLSKPGIYIPEGYWEDKQGVSFVYKKFKHSMGDLIKLHRRQGKFIPMNVMQKYVDEFTNWLDKIHKSKKTETQRFFHCRIKPSNLFEDEDGGCVITDFNQFSNENNENYLPPESIATLKKNQSQRFSQGTAQADQFGGDPQKIDVWQLGMVFLQMASLREMEELLVFRDFQAHESQKGIEIREIVRKAYGNHFNNLIEKMLEKNPNNRPPLSEVEDLVQDFFSQNAIIADETLITPQPELLLEELKEKAKQLKSQTATQYLSKYQLQPVSRRIKPEFFWEALQDLKIEVTAKEKSAFLAQFDNSKKDEIDLSQWVQNQKEIIKLGELNDYQEQELSEMMKELHKYLEEQKINLLEKFKENDTELVGYLQFEKFDQTLKDNQINLAAEDIPIIQQKYDPKKKNIIYYEQFCEDTKSMNQQQLGFNDLKMKMYRGIREIHNIFIQFFRHYDTKSRGELSHEEIHRFLNDLKIHPSPDIEKQLLSHLDPTNKKSISFENVRVFFEELINEDVRAILQEIVNGLASISMTLPQLIRSNTKSASIITKNQLFNAFKQANDGLKNSDFTFLMSIFGVKDEIEYPQFINAMVQKGKDLKISNWKLLQELEVKEQKQEKKSAFDDPEESMHKSIKFNAKQFDPQKQLLQFIYKQLQEREQTPRQYFKSTFQRMSITQYKEKIRQLEIYKGDYEIEQEELLNNLLVPHDKSLVDVDLLIEAILYYKDKKIEQYRYSQHKAIMFLEQLNKQMKKKRITFADIEDLDTLGDGYIRKKQFQDFVNKQLQLDTGDNQFQDFLTSIQQDQQNISLHKLKQGLKLDEASNKLLSDINTELAYEQSKPEQVFKKYDANRNTKLELREFAEFLVQLVGDVDQKIVESLFLKLDANGDNTINLYEFKQKISHQENDISEQQQTKYKYKQTAQTFAKQLTPQIMKAVFRLKDALRENNESLEIFDKKGRGQILLNAFQDIIVSLGFEFQEFKQLAQYLLSPEDKKFLQYDKLAVLMHDCEEAEQLLINLNQTIQSGKVATASLFYNYDQNGNDVLDKQEFYKLIRDIDPMSRNKPVDNLFLLLDSNQDGSISISEFKSKVCTKDKPRVMATINKQQLSIFDDVMKFAKDSPALLGEFEIRDENYTNKLDLDTFIMVLKKNNGPNIQLLEMKALADQLGALQGNNVNYKIFCLKAKQYQVETPSTKIEAIATKLRDQLKNKNTNVIEISQEFDINHKGKVKVKALKMGMTDKSIALNDNEWELLLTIIEQDAQDYIDYYAFNDFINLGLAKYKESRKVLVLNTNQEIDRIVKSFTQYLEKEVCTLLAMYRQTDKDKNNFISFEEFTALLLKTIGYSTTVDNQKQLFDIFDMDKDGKINFTEFEYQIYKRNEITAKQIQEMKLVMLNGRNPQMEQQLSDLFLIISQGSQFIEFKQFANYINYFQKYSMLELDQFFRYFDQEYSEKLDQFRFILGFKQQQRQQSIQSQSQPQVQIPQQQPYQQNVQPQPSQFQEPPQFQQPQYQQQQQQNGQQMQYGQQQQYPGQQQQFPGQQQQFPGQQQQQFPGQQQQFPGQQPQYNAQQSQYNGQQKPQYNNQLPQQQQQYQQYNPQYNQQEASFNASIPNSSIAYPPQNTMYNKQVPQEFDKKQEWVQNAKFEQSWVSQGQDQYSQKYDPNQSRAAKPQPQQSQIPIEFDLNFYDQEIQKKCIQKNIDLFDLLCQYDETPLPELKISRPDQLELAFQFLEILAPTPHVQQYYYYYSQGQNQMGIVLPYLKMNNPGKLLAKALNFTMIKHKQYTKQQLWGLIGENQPTWQIKQLDKINSNLKIGLNERELREAFQYWDTEQKGLITFKIYEEVLNLNQIVIPQKQDTQSKDPALQSVLDSFLLHLSEAVLAKNCFNLFEQLDKRGYNQIPFNDFLSVSKKLIGSISADEIKSIKQLLQQNGFINLSDLAKFLNVDRTKINQYSQEDEKQQFGLAQKDQRKSILNTQNKEKFNKMLPIINEFLKKRSKTYDDFALYFFPPNSNSTIDRVQFTKKALDAQFGLSATQCEELYDYLDANSSGHISINEFRLVFQSKQTEQQIKKQADNIVQSQDIEQEILDLFNQIDENKNQQLDQRELLKALQSVGLNPGTEELSQYFAQFDRDRSGTISYQEFSHIVKDILKKELLQADDLLEDLRREFRQVCNPTTRMLSKEQVSQVFQNMGVLIKNEELTDLFVEIDEDKSGSIDIDEFIYFIQKNQSGMSAKASAAVMNIKGSRRISLHDLKEIFLQLPQNFIMSFVRGQNKKLQNLPSSQLKPVLDNCGFFYQGLNYVEASNFNIKQSILDKVNIKNNFLAEIRLIEATGIPIPDEKDVPRGSFLRREIGIILIDKAINKYEGNAVYIPAAWNPEYEDRWVFEQPAMEQAILMRWGNFDEKLDNLKEMVFEFITYSVNKGRLIQISCAYGSIPVYQLKPGKQILELKGGAPLKDITIDKKDIRTNRNGWRSVVKALSSNIKSQLILEVMKLPPLMVQKISALPNKCMLNKWALSMQSAFREYFAYRTQMKGEIELNLASDIRIRAWLHCFDCPDTTRPIALFWNEFIEPKVGNDYQFLLKSISKIADSLYLMFKNTEFKFSIGDPTARIDHDSVLLKRRQQLVAEAISDMKINLGIVIQQQKKAQIITSLEPLNVEEMMDLDNESDIQALEKFFSKKKTKKQQ
ncbi:unnamed protein product (macronuclear) [Paramecium tetraurelia]|uniref:Protein kinase-like domain n=1 Tax=Paramecium tetraurelia TaxID=5888 RepID=A0CC00_PARTE|nr:uncharacterized protein GSPATT00037101001 [Paramecium tetraurelia]CAK68317.1 unnamed protein product [Paramecium tetraurelia]|eukprot:XP_001435714.1 hypothetical protein (macronuclear) [Paramecium tetraurelia strain d4-2]